MMTPEQKLLVQKQRYVRESLADIDAARLLVTMRLQNLETYLDAHVSRCKIEACPLCSLQRGMAPSGPALVWSASAQQLQEPAPKQLTPLPLPVVKPPPTAAAKTKPRVRYDYSRKGHLLPAICNRGECA